MNQIKGGKQLPNHAYDHLIRKLSLPLTIIFEVTKHDYYYYIDNFDKADEALEKKLTYIQGDHEEQSVFFK